MTHHYFAPIALVAASLLAGPALATDTSVSKTRVEVKAELAEAVRTGSIVRDNPEAGHTMRELYPNNYPAEQVVNKTREQVKAELAEAIRTGDIVRDNPEAGLKMNELYPNRYPVKQVISKTREEVRAELLEARAMNTIPEYSRG